MLSRICRKSLPALLQFEAHGFRNGSIARHISSRTRKLLDSPRPRDVTGRHFSTVRSRGSSPTQSGMPTRLTTLDPEKLQHADYIDLSNTSRFLVDFTSHEGDPVPLRNKITPFRFPDNCRGFLYFHREPGQPVTAASVRFRLADGPTLADFLAGKDLTYETKRFGTRIWTMNIFTSLITHASLRSQLLADGLISERDIQFCNILLHNNDIKNEHAAKIRSQALSSMTDPFELDLSDPTLRLHIYDTEKELLSTVDRRSPLLARPLKETGYKGKCLVRFEPAPTWPTDAGSIKCRIRVLDIISPITQTGAPTKVSFPKKDSYLSLDGKILSWWIRPNPKGTPRERITRRDLRMPALSTLDISRVQPSDIRDVSGYAGLRIDLSCGTPRVRYRNNSKQQFPPDTIGFFYFHHNPQLHPVSREIRFRLATDSSEGALDSGEDLVAPDGVTPWAIPLLTLVQFSVYQPFVNQLLEEGLVSPEDIHLTKQILQTSERTRIKGGRRSSIRIYDINQPFLLDYSGTVHRTFHFISTEPPMIHSGQHRGLVGEAHQKPPRDKPYTGKCLAQLEQAPERGEMGQKTFFLRVLKIVEPFECLDPNYTGALGMPEEGALIHKHGRPLVVDTFNPPIF